jgi:DNA-binding NarL/FixJ family response regulator
MSKVQVFIIDDHPFFRSGIVHWLNQQPSFACCGEAGSVAEAKRALTNITPDVILADLHLGDGEGLELIREVAEIYPQTRIIAVSQLEEDHYAHRALRAGARGYVMKNEATETVLEAISTVIQGSIYVSRRVAARLTHNLFPDRSGQSPTLAALSDRELQVFKLLGSGLGTREIAEHLKISPKTVETYREHLKTKLLLDDSKALIQAAEHWINTGKFLSS